MLGGMVVSNFKMTKALQDIFCLAPVVLLLVSITRPLCVESQFPRSMRNTWDVLSFLVLSVVCLLFTIICVLLRFVLYVIENYKNGTGCLSKNALAFFVKEPYHNLLERISDVTMTVQAIVCLAFLVFYLGSLGYL